MKWSIFTRLMTGYLALLLLATAVSVYAIIQLGNVEDATRSVILVDNPLLDLHKSLSDTLLSEQRYEKKFVLMRDDLLYRGFVEATAQFERQLRAAALVADSPGLKAVLARAAEQHRTYDALFREEARHVRSGRRYAETWYRDAKEKTLAGLSDELADLRSLTQKSILEKVKRLSEAGARAKRVGMISAAAAVGAGALLSLVITAGITRPLNEMQRKMGEVSGGIREVDLSITSPPEVAALADSFTLMCGKLKRLDAMKADFYALMSHELRTPLTSIRESTNLFLEGRAGAITERQQRLLSITAEESNRLIELVNSLLDISKLEAGMLAYNFATADLNPLIGKAMAEVSPLAEAKRIRIEKDLGELPPLSLDTERILQVLRNLIGNALKFTPRGGRITISSIPCGRGVSVSIKDTGPGISREQAAVIFDKYCQAGTASPHKIQGSGLGLAIVKHIVQDHGGSVWVESGGGPGSTFTFVLPA